MTAERRSFTTAQRIWLVWAVLVAATIASLVFSVELRDARVTLVTIMVVTAGKAVLVVREFMEVGRCGRVVRVGFSAWPVLAAAVIVGIYLTAVI